MSASEGGYGRRVEVVRMVARGLASAVPVPRPDRKHLRRPEILDAAVEELLARGYDNVRLADVAARVGATKAMPLHYWRSREALLDEALVHADEGFQARLEAEMAELATPVERLRHLLHRCAVEDAAAGFWPLWFELWRRALRSPQLREAHARQERRYRELIAELVREGRASGAFPEGEPEDVALVLSALMDGVAVAVVLGDPAFDAGRTERLLRATAERLLGAQLERRPSSVL
jgi:AcrR family transcriptional regulator